MKVDNNNALCYNMNIVNIVYFSLKIVYLLSCKKPLKIPINGFFKGLFCILRVIFSRFARQATSKQAKIFKKVKTTQKETNV